MDRARTISPTAELFTTRPADRRVTETGFFGMDSRVADLLRSEVYGDVAVTSRVCCFRTRDYVRAWSAGTNLRERSVAMRLNELGTIGTLTSICVAAAIVVGADHKMSAKDDKDRDSDSYTIGLFGDMPYNALGKAQYPALLADINHAHVEFSVHDGDLK